MATAGTAPRNSVAVAIAATDWITILATAERARPAYCSPRSFAQPLSPGSFRPSTANAGNSVGSWAGVASSLFTPAAYPTMGYQRVKGGCETWGLCGAKVTG